MKKSIINSLLILGIFLNSASAEVDTIAETLAETLERTKQLTERTKELTETTEELTAKELTAKELTAKELTAKELTAEELTAEQLTMRVVEYYNENGAETTFTDINEGAFNYGNFYPFVFEARHDGKFIASDFPSSSSGLESGIDIKAIEESSEERYIYVILFSMELTLPGKENLLLKNFSNFSNFSSYKSVSHYSNRSTGEEGIWVEGLWVTYDTWYDSGEPRTLRSWVIYHDDYIFGVATR